MLSLMRLQGLSNRQPVMMTQQTTHLTRSHSALLHTPCAAALADLLVQVVSPPLQLLQVLLLHLGGLLGICQLSIGGINLPRQSSLLGSVGQAGKQQWWVVLVETREQ